MPIPNVYTATEDPTSQVGNNGDIYFHTGLSDGINVYKKSSGLWGFIGAISKDGTLEGRSEGSSIFIGAHAGEHLTDVSTTSIVIGFEALPQQTANNSDNTIIGYRAGGSLTGDTDVFGFQNTLIGQEADIYTVTREAGTQNVSQSVAVGAGAIAVGNQSVSIGFGADALGTNQIVIGYGVSIHLDSPDNIAVVGNSDVTDVYFGSTSGAAKLHGKGNAIVFPDSDPHIVGAGYWLAGVLTRSSG